MSSSEKPAINCQATRYHIKEDTHLNFQRPEIQSHVNTVANNPLQA
jgi:hypothetical protein